MAEIALTAPYVMNSATLQIGTDGYTAAVDSAIFRPTSKTSTWTGIGGNSITTTSPPTWDCQLSYVQDLDPAGLAQYLHTNAGKQVPMTLTPVTADGEPGADVAITAMVTIVPGQLGGKAGSDLASATVTMGVTGTPQITSA